MLELSVQTKSYVVLAIVLGCFGILYPKIFHPMVLSAFGLNKPTPAPDESMPVQFFYLCGVLILLCNVSALLHPRERIMRSAPSARPPLPNSRPYGHSPPHPGMRMASEGVQGRPGGPGRGGIMSMILPMYAIGIVLYLLYTLLKVFGGNKSKRSGEAGERVQQQNLGMDRSAGSLFEDIRE